MTYNKINLIKIILGYILLLSALIGGIHLYLEQKKTRLDVDFDAQVHTIFKGYSRILTLKKYESIKVESSFSAKDDIAELNKYLKQNHKAQRASKPHECYNCVDGGWVLLEVEMPSDDRLVVWEIRPTKLVYNNLTNYWDKLYRPNIEDCYKMAYDYFIENVPSVSNCSNDKGIFLKNNYWELYDIASSIKNDYYSYSCPDWGNNKGYWADNQYYIENDYCKVYYVGEGYDYYKTFDKAQYNKDFIIILIISMIIISIMSFIIFY